MDSDNKTRSDTKVLADLTYEARKHRPTSVKTTPSERIKRERSTSPMKRGGKGKGKVQGKRLPFYEPRYSEN